MPASTAVKKAVKKDLGHRIRVIFCAALAVLLVTSIGVYGLRYYILPMEQRPYSDLHPLLKPSGLVGINLGVFGTFLFFIIFLYAFRKIIPWLGRWGSARHWMDFHVIAGITAPFIIAFHASFKFQGIAGFAFWIMTAVAVSGVIGRYLYAQIPRSLNAADASLKESTEEEQQLSEALISQSLYSAKQLSQIFNVPTADHLRKIGAFGAFCEMIVLDVRRPLQVAALRRSASTTGRQLLSLGGILSSGDREIEQVIELVREKASLSKKVIFLGTTQKIFHLWHVIHRPFSYAFALLAVMHIAVVMGLGFMSLGWR
jgi:hypothetical protein